ncbi:neuroblast differentiation-associated protein AHNAK-like [Boleophthalmus pectinirostris]|uniref:neuroblast differentiation-associated protein AHNAK-like n=1 Tax=Boleophthalmus pectinirostris TaxID=150288 RepID=UPI00242B41C8|nr:neuroblast differentiation-associated protein AHNAK-like [Boleophthalmus pectinirostris]
MDKLSHRRGRSLSDALTLEQSDDGGVVISSINTESDTQELRAGDELVGASINFDHLSKDEVLQVLKAMEPFNSNVRVLTRSNMSKSMENLDQIPRDHTFKSPETMLNDSYNKLYNTKIKKYLKSGSVDAETLLSRDVSLKPNSSKLNANSGLPRLGVDFGLLKPKNKNLDAESSALSGSVAGDFGGSNMNLPPLGLGGSQLGLNTNLNGPNVNLSGSFSDIPDYSSSAGLQLPSVETPGLKVNGGLKAPS